MKKLILLLCFVCLCSLLPAQTVTFTAYNDCVYSASAGQYKPANTTAFGIGGSFSGATSGRLLDFTTGAQTNVTAKLTQSGYVGWNETTAAGGRDCAIGTDAYNLFGGKADMTGVITYGEAGWWVEITFTGLNPERLYTFATSASRDAYTDRYTVYTLRGADFYHNASSTGTTILSEDSVRLETGGNHAQGYVARWTGIRALDGTFTVRAASDPSSPEGKKAYAFSLFMLQEVTGNRSPYQPALLAPAAGAQVGTTSVALQARVTDPDNNPLAVNFYGRKVPASTATFTLIALPDIQNYSQSYPEVLTSQTTWIKANAASRNIVFVSQEGDVVNSSGSTVQYQNAKNGMSVLDNFVPYALAHGNHDVPTDNFNLYFPYTAFQGKAWYGGHYPSTSNNNSYQLVSACGVDLLMLHLGYSPGYDTLTWANSVLHAYPQRKAIITTHAFLDAYGTRSNIYGIDSSEYIWLNLIEQNPNVYFVLCGHVHAENRRIDTAFGHPVYQILADYQDDPNGGNGWLRIMEFSPRDNKVHVQTYSPWLGQYRTGTASEFELDFVMNDFTEVGQVSNAASNSEVTLTWPGLEQGATYEWYAQSSDGELRSSSTTSRFTVGAGAGHFKAYNDCVFVPANQYKAANVTTYGVGDGYTGATAGKLVDVTTGADTGVQVLITRNRVLHWQMNEGGGGTDCLPGTDAYTTFGGITDMEGVIYYDLDNNDWWMDLTFIGLDPAKHYTFAASASRNNYTDRKSTFTISGADTYQNASTSGVTVLAADKVSFNTGGNHTEGYVARWSNISASKGTFTVRAQPSPDAPENGRKAYGFSVFMLEEESE